jgi:hypothetical protein
MSLKGQKSLELQKIFYFSFFKREKKILIFPSGQIFLVRTRKNTLQMKKRVPGFIKHFTAGIYAILQ